MTLYEVSEMMANSGYPYAIAVDSILAEADIGFVYKEGDDENPVAKLVPTPNDDITVKVGGKDDVTFADPTDVIMWIIQTL